MIDAEASLEALVRAVVDRPLPMARLARLLLTMGHGERARKLCARASSMAPCNGEVYALAAEVFSYDVPTWYVSMVQDKARHKIYEEAFRRAIKPGSRVLDIGSGTGLFAMMAARMGAAEVITCEQNTVVAAAVSEVVARNGLVDRVRVVAKNSADLKIGVDLNGPADVVVWDNLTRSLIGAGALPTIERAVRHMARPGARVIPARGAIRVALAEDRKSYLDRMGIVEGFDLSPFNKLLGSHYTVPVNRDRIVLRSKPEDLFRFDFESGGPFPESRTEVSLSCMGGRVTGVEQWIRLELDGDAHYENAPPADNTSSLRTAFYPFMRPIEASPGSNLTVCGAHDRLSLRIWADVAKVR
jgi:protein arginine N-methyltransferase 7